MHVPRRVRSLVIALALPGALAVASPALAVNDPVFFPGVYVQINPVTKKPLAPGSSVTLVRSKSGQFGFSLNAIRAVDSNQGFVAGSFRPATTVVWEQKAESGNCRLTFKPVASGMTIAQDAKFGDCGFGYGVFADGIYKWMGDKPPKA